MIELGLILLFSSNAIIVQDPWMGLIIRTARKVRQLFELHSLHLSSPGLSAFAAFPSTSSSPELWYSCLGHSSSSPVQLLVFMGILSTTSNSLFDCMACQLGKQLAFPFNTTDSYALTPFDIVHSDVWGPSLFQQWEVHDILLFLLMTFLITLGFKIVMKFLQFNVIFTK